MRKRFVFIGLSAAIILVGLAGIFLWRCSDDWCFVFHWQKARTVDSFERCAELGFPIMESSPRRCAASGKTYTENIPQVIHPPNTQNTEIRDSTPVPGETIPTGTGTLEGTMTIGPVCPVERIDHPCTPTPEMYAVRKVFVYAKDQKTLIATLTPDAKGKFHVTLSQGTYFIDMVHQGIGRMSGVPVTVFIATGKSATLAIAVDTGIR